MNSNNSLRKSVLNGAIWTLISVAGGQTIRLGKSLILSRLLFPEAYGEMAIVWAVLYALDMLSDVGLAAGIIRSKRGDDPDFLNTGWTMKVIRGFCLCSVSWLVAYPVSKFYHMPQLALLIPVAGLTILIEGFCSTKVYSNQRNMVYNRITLLEFTNDLVGLVVTLAWAYIYPSVWALLGGAVVGRIYHVAASHALLPGARNRLHWDRDALHELLHFGKWIFYSSMVYLLYSQGDRFLLGKILDTKTLGVYSVAVMLSEAVTGVINKLNDTVIFPALSRVVNSEPHRLKQVFYKARIGTDAMLALPIGVLMVIGSTLVAHLYDIRYHEAGWMLQILCVRLVMSTMLINGASCLFSLGQSQYAVIQNILRVIWLFVGVTSIWPFYGIKGVVWVVALTEIPALAVVWVGLYKHKILSLLHESRTLLAVGCGAGIGVLIKLLANGLGVV